MTEDVGLGADLLWSPRFVARIAGADDAGDAIEQTSAPLVAAGAVLPSFVEAVASQRGLASAVPAAVPYAILGDGRAGALRLAAAVGIFKTPVPFSRAADSSVPADVRILAIVGRPEGDPASGAIEGLRRAIGDGELAEMLLDLPVEEAHQLLCEAVGFYTRRRDPIDERATPTRPDSSRESRVRAIWRLLEAGDNFLKYARSADRERANERARKKFEEALEQARLLDHEKLATVATARLHALPPAPTRGDDR